MGFEYDEQKSLTNKEKHQIDFLEAQNLWHDPFRIMIPTKFVKEQRYLLLAENIGDIWSAIFTHRGNNIRIISVRKARKNEKEIYFGKRI